MNKRPPKIKKRLPPIELIYRQVELGESTMLLDRAFDILFDEVLRMRGLKVKKCPQMDVDS